MSVQRTRLRTQYLLNLRPLTRQRRRFSSGACELFVVLHKDRRRDSLSSKTQDTKVKDS